MPSQYFYRPVIDNKFALKLYHDANDKKDGDVCFSIYDWIVEGLEESVVEPVYFASALPVRLKDLDVDLGISPDMHVTEFNPYGHFPRYYNLNPVNGDLAYCSEDKEIYFLYVYMNGSWGKYEEPTLEQRVVSLEQRVRQLEARR